MFDLTLRSWFHFSKTALILKDMVQQGQFNPFNVYGFSNDSTAE